MNKELANRVEYVISLAKQVPFYKRKAEEAGLDLDKIKTPDDLFEAYRKGFYTTSADLPQLVYYRDPDAKSFTTSGTKGKPKEVCLNPDDHKTFVEQYTVGFIASLPQGAVALNCLPREPAISGYVTKKTLDAMNYLCIDAPAQDIAGDPLKFLHSVKQARPNSLVALSTFPYRMAFQLSEMGAEPKELGIRSIVVGGEPSTVERRRTIGNEFSADVFDFYASSESHLMAFEMAPFSNKYAVNLPHTLMFLLRGPRTTDEGEVGDVVLSNLFDPKTVSKPWMVLLNYKIGDWASCLKKEGCVVTHISNIRREAAYLAGAKLEPAEIETCIEVLGDYKDLLTGEYCIINYHDKDRKAVAEIRLEARRNLSDEDKRKIGEGVTVVLYSFNIPVKTLVESIKDARLRIEITPPGELYRGYEQYIKPGKPRRLISSE